MDSMLHNETEPTPLPETQPLTLALTPDALQRFGLECEPGETYTATITFTAMPDEVGGKTLEISDITNLAEGGMPEEVGGMEGPEFEEPAAPAPTKSPDDMLGFPVPKKKKGAPFDINSLR